MILVATITGYIRLIWVRYNGVTVYVVTPLAKNFKLAPTTTDTILMNQF